MLKLVECPWITSWGTHWCKSNCNFSVTLSRRCLFSLNYYYYFSQSAADTINPQSPSASERLVCLVGLSLAFKSPLAHLYWPTEISTPTVDSATSSPQSLCGIATGTHPRLAQSLKRGTDGCEMTLAYELSPCTPEAKCAIGGWGKHRLIIVNNLQAGSRIKDRWRDERRHFWQKALNHPAGVSDCSCSPGSLSPYTDGLFETRPHSLNHHLFHPLQDTTPIENVWKLTELKQLEKGDPPLTPPEFLFFV